MATKPITLGEKLSGKSALKSGRAAGAWVWHSLKRVVIASLFTGISAFALWWFMGQPDLDRVLAVIVLGVLFVFWWIATRPTRESRQHFLLENDRSGFMHGLRLDEKTAVLDGSNIYHFGHDNGLDAQPLGEVADLLRSQGYRVVCFFDANIFFTLGEHGAFGHGTRHSLAMLEDVFGLGKDEIYVVPSGVQADGYILECLKHMPISFAVTNDRFRDYADQYSSVMGDALWRKGVVISGGIVKLQPHRP